MKSLIKGAKDMKKIIIAGAGHGGISAAINLARNGYDVTIYEQNKREGLGHDWHDSIVLKTFGEIGIDEPDKSTYLPMPGMRYAPPSKSKELWNGKERMTHIVSADRKELYKHLLKNAEESGVKLCFETHVKCAVFDKEKIIGIKVADENGERIEKADLIIDAAGMHSPVRQSLRQCCGIRNCFSSKETFYVYRAYYENLSKEETPEKYTVYLYHNHNAGMDWVITNNDFYDILVGSFNPINNEIIKNAVEDFHKEYPDMGEKVIRGGYVANIPLCNPLPKYVYDNYAAVGDSAGMTEPMSGSGIDLSMKAGKILSDVIIEAGDKELTTEVLWKYQYTYAKRYGKYYADQNLRVMLEGLNGQVIDDFIGNDVITIKEIGGGGLKIESAAEAIQKAKGFIPHADILPGILKMIQNGETIKEVKKTIPEKYTEEAFLKWKKLYETL